MTTRPPAAPPLALPPCCRPDAPCWCAYGVPAAAPAEAMRWRPGDPVVRFPPAPPD